MGEMGKVNYEPSQTKIFEISKDSISRERIKILKDILLEMKNILPDVEMGISLFGSLSKGKQLTQETASVSDIDATLYIDYDQLCNKYSSLTEENAATDLEKQLLLLKERGIKIENKRSKPIRIVIQFFIEYFEKIFNQKGIKLGSGILSVVELISLHDESSILFQTDLLERSMNANQKGITDLNAMIIGSFFQLDVGGGLKKYKTQFFEDLYKIWQQDKTRAQLKWTNVLQSMKFVARGNEAESFETFQLPSQLNKLFPPENLEDAFHYYKIFT